MKIIQFALSFATSFASSPYFVANTRPSTLLHHTLYLAPSSHYPQFLDPDFTWPKHPAHSPKAFVCEYLTLPKGFRHRPRLEMWFAAHGLAIVPLAVAICALVSSSDPPVRVMLDPIQKKDLIPFILFT